MLAMKNPVSGTLTQNETSYAVFEMLEEAIRSEVVACVLRFLSSQGPARFMQASLRQELLNRCGMNHRIHRCCRR